jgi:natural product biosynthesis luciferase-like monooxygenase protein
MSNYEQRLAALSPEQRKLFEKRLKEKLPQPQASASVESLPPEKQFWQTMSEQSAPAQTASTEVQPDQLKPLQFSLIFFSDDSSQRTEGKYDLVLQAARYADQQGFTAVWTPERHLHRFGGQYPNPAVLGAALAMITEKLQIRAGSVVLPLHHPVRIAEEWAVVDNLSHGRVGLSFASGWVPNDFILARKPYTQRRETLFEDLPTFIKLWRGESVRFSTPEQIEVDAQTYPAPFNGDVPIWITSTGNPDTWLKAGEIGANILTALLQQSVEEVSEKVALYRAARAQHGHDPETGIVTLMLHTFIWNEAAMVYQKIHDPLLAYMQTHLDMRKQMAKAMGKERDAERFTADDQAVLAEMAFSRYFNNNGLFGTPQTCQQMLRRLQYAGVDEIACLMDFGIDTETLLESLRYLSQAREAHLAQTAAGQ